VGRCLRSLGLVTKRSTGGYSYLLWDAKMIQCLAIDYGVLEVEGGANDHHFRHFLHPGAVMVVTVVTVCRDTRASDDRS